MERCRTRLLDRRSLGEGGYPREFRARFAADLESDFAQLLASRGRRAAWVFKGTRTPVAIAFENLEDGMTLDEVWEQFPVTREQAGKAVLEFATRSLDVPVPGR